MAVQDGTALAGLRCVLRDELLVLRMVDGVGGDDRNGFLETIGHRTRSVERQRAQPLARTRECAFERVHACAPQLLLRAEVHAHQAGVDLRRPSDATQVGTVIAQLRKGVDGGGKQRRTAFGQVFGATAPRGRYGSHCRTTSCAGRVGSAAWAVSATGAGGTPIA